MTLSLLTDQFKMVNGDGLLLNEPFTTVSMRKNAGTVSFALQNGPSGRGYIMQQSAELNHWTNCSLANFVAASNNTAPLFFTCTSSGDKSFYRAMATNAIPP